MTVSANKTGRSVVLTAYKYLKDQKNFICISDILHDEYSRDLLNGVFEEMTKTEEISGTEVEFPSLEYIISKIDEEGTADIGDTELILCDYAKRARHFGLLPYYICGLIAQVIRNSENQRYITEKNGLYKAIKEFCGIDKEIQLITQIAESYEQIEKGIVKSREYIELVKKAYEKGFAYEQKYGGCAQCSIAACCETVGKDPEPVFMPATVLSGGCAVCIDGSCGSYSGAAIIIGSFIGRSFSGMLSGSDDENYQRANELGQKLHKKYIDTYGGVTCKDVQTRVFGRSFLLSDKNEVADFKAAGAHEDKCPSVVAVACAWAVGILHDEKLI